MKADLATLIETISEKQLRKLLLKYALIHDDIREEVLASPLTKAKKFDDLSLQEWKRRIKDAMDEDLAGEMDDYYANKYVDWDNTVRKMKEAVSDLTNRGLNQECLSLLDEIEEAITENSGIEFETADEGYDIYVEYDESWIQEFEKLRCAVAESSDELKESLFDHYCQRASEGDLVSEWLTSFTLPRDKAVQLDIILSFLNKHRKNLNDSLVAEYASAAFDLKKSLNPEKIEELFREYPASRVLRERMDSLYEQSGRIDLSIKLLQEDLREDPLSLSKSDRLISLYLKEGDKALAERELRRRIEQNYHVELSTLRQFYELAAKKAAEEVSTAIIGGKYNDSLKIEACKEIGRVEELKTLLNERARRFLLDDRRSSSFLSDYICPSDSFVSSQDEEFIPELLKNLVETQLQTARKREDYKTLASLLGYLSSGSPSRQEKAECCASDLLKKYKNRPAMREVFNAHGFTGS